MRRVSNMTAGGRKKSLRAMVVAGNYNGVAGIKLGLPEVILKGHMTLLLVWSLYVQKKKVTCSCCFSVVKNSNFENYMYNTLFQLKTSAFFLCFVFISYSSGIMIAIYHQFVHVCRILIVHVTLCVLCRFWCR